MAGFSVSPNVVSNSFPLNVLHGGAKTPPAATKVTTPGPTLEATQTSDFVAAKGSAGLSYLGSHLVYVVVFIVFTLAMFYVVGKKSTTYFLVLVLVGQLIIPDGTGAGITSLFNSFKTTGGSGGGKGSTRSW